VHVGIVLVPLRLKQVPLVGQLLSRSAFLSSVRVCLYVNGQVVTYVAHEICGSCQTCEQHQG